MNGIECIESLRATLAWNIPAIMMTCDTRLQTREAIASHGYSLLIKPFLCEELMQLINELSRSPEPSHHNLSAGRVRHIDNRPQV
jgi:DNA-binding response OmpR family regulator